MNYKRALAFLAILSYLPICGVLGGYFITGIFANGPGAALGVGIGILVPAAGAIVMLVLSALWDLAGTLTK